MIVAKMLKIADTAKSIWKKEALQGQAFQSGLGRYPGFPKGVGKAPSFVVYAAHDPVILFHGLSDSLRMGGMSIFREAQIK